MFTLAPTEIQGLNDAPDDEFRARETCRQGTRDFGAVRPFSNIVGAEQRHTEARLNLFGKYTVAPPINRWPGHLPHFGSVQAAWREDILAVYSALRSASEDRHLHAFRRCSQGGDGGRGPGSH
ncbi:hypothetical protein [Thiohalophilus sp.]|uniref:hypothetical protein n=1 Tax=Thiohalophilus sp. TaxID=3028392 RepID=UPI002ACE18B2|nr:hypothetical protein [Thiohalophilus sp.]MDZ7803127.1 hypothetical protein [Thiohalophilus sp.]